MPQCIPVGHSFSFLFSLCEEEFERFAWFCSAGGIYFWSRERSEKCKKKMDSLARDNDITEFIID